MRSRSRRPALTSALLCAGIFAAALHPAAAAELEVKGDPQQLVVQRDELPSPFAMAGGEYQGQRAYSAVYFNPQALLEESKTDRGLLGVIVNVTLLANAAAAGKEFAAQGGLDEGSMLDGLGGPSANLTMLDREPYAVSLEGTQRVAGFRVHYRIEGTDVHEYRFRFVLGNALVNLIVSERATPDGSASPMLQHRAHRVLDSQVARLLGATTN